MITVQYFERVRFELAPGGQVRLGLRGRELGGLAALCPPAAPAAPAAITPAAPSPDTGRPPAPTSAGAPGVALIGSLAQIGDIGGWLPTLTIGALLLVILVLVGFAIIDWRTFKQRGARRSYRRRRTAHDRFAAEPAPPPAPPAPAAPAAPAAVPAADGAAVRRSYGVAADLALDDAWDEAARPARPAARPAPGAEDEDELLRQLLGGA